MDSCFLKRILIATGAGAVAGIGGYIVKGSMTGALGAGVGGIAGWLLSPKCEEEIEVIEGELEPFVESAALPAESEAPALTAAQDVASEPVRRRRLIPQLKPMSERCRGANIWNAKVGACVPNIR